VAFERGAEEFVTFFVPFSKVIRPKLFGQKQHLNTLGALPLAAVYAQFGWRDCRHARHRTPPETAAMSHFP
jgi:hypothetical protein